MIRNILTTCACGHDYADDEALVYAGAAHCPACGRVTNETGVSDGAIDDTGLGVPAVRVQLDSEDSRTEAVSRMQVREVGYTERTVTYRYASTG